MSSKKVTIKYVKALDFKTSLSTGIYGGITNNGLINMNLFVDRVIIPTHEHYPVDEKGLIIGTPESDKDGDLLREVQHGALFDISTAKIVQAWLGKKIDELESEIENKK
jgi:hypothetical protein